MTSLFPEGSGLSLTAPSTSTTSDYLPLYRKYRPQGLTELVGQQSIVQTLSNAINHNRLTHAYLFCGPRGTGKTSSARIMAKSLNCAEGPTPTPCQVCPSCVSITNGTALDVTEIDAASNNGVDNIRELSERVQFKAIDGKYRIYIIDEVHMLSTAAFNALLKTLEEPPPGVIFIFATTEPHKVLPTILSRCQRYDFSRITRQDIEGQLQKVADLEGFKISQPALTLIARTAKGGMRDALSLLDQVSVFGRDNDTITPEQVRLVTGGLTEENLLKLSEFITQQDSVGLVNQIKALADHGIEPSLIAKELLGHFKNLLLTLAAKDVTQIPMLSEMLDVSEDTAQFVKNQSQNYTLEELNQMVQRLAQLEFQLKNTPTPLLWLEVTLIALCFREQIHSFKALNDRIEQLESQLVGGTLPKAPAAARAVTPQPQVQASSIPQQQTPIQHTNISQPEPVAVVQQPVVSAPAPQAPVVQPEAPVIQAQELAQPQAELIPTPAPVEPAAPSIRPVVTSSDDLFGTFQEILLMIEQIPIRALMEQHAHIVEMNDKNLVVGFSTEGTLNIFNQPNKLKVFEDAVAKALGAPKQVKLVVKATEKKNNPITPQSPELNFSMPTSAPPVMEPSVDIQQNNTAIPSTPLPPIVERDMDLLDAKRYTQELLGARIVES